MTEPLYRAAAHIWSKESERLQEHAKEVRDAAIPAKMGTLLLEVWEAFTHLPRNPSGKTTTERWELVLGRLRRIIEDPSATAWVQRVTEQIGASWTYEEEGPDIIRVKVPFAPASEGFLTAERVLLAEIPAAWELILESVEGFVLDLSKLDLEPFGA